MAKPTCPCLICNRAASAALQRFNVHPAHLPNAPDHLPAREGI